MKRLLGAVVAVLFLAFPLPALADSAVPKNQGLFITPVRDYITVVPGTTVTKSIVLANNTSQQIHLSLSVEQFSVLDYSNDYKFDAAREDWCKPAITQLELAPGKSQSVSYAVSPPQNAIPGGHYFTLVATAEVEQGADKSRVQAATVLYVTVSGELRTTSQILRSSIPHVVFGDIPYSFTVKNTGNTHFFVYVNGGFDAMDVPQQSVASTHVLMPQAIREIGGTIAAPLLPGFYTAAYGYLTENGQKVVRTARIIYLPPWSLLLAIGLILASIFGYRHWRKKRLFRGF